MKKLMIAAAIVCAAVVSQAATTQWKWSIDEYSPLAAPGELALLESGNAYLFASTTAGSAAFMKTLVDDFAAGTLSLTGYEQNDAVSAGMLSQGTVEWGDSRTMGTVVDWVMAVTATDSEGNKYLFIDNLPATRLDDGKAQGVLFSVVESSMASVMEASGSYQGSGWYSAAAVPEPTSGLLLLLGVAGLALRRRRA